jgi:hypothetical protein
LLWDLYVGQVPLQPLTEVALGDSRARVQDHGGGHVFPKRRMRDREHRRLGDHCVPKQDLFYLQRRHFLSTSVDHLFEAPADAQIAFGVQEALIAGAKPPLVEGSRIGVVVMFVRGHDRLAADADLALRLVGKQPTVLAQDGDVGTSRKPDRSGLANPRR